MGDAGYTLAETLLGLAILSLAIGGLSTGVQVLGDWQAATASTISHLQNVNAAQLRLDDLAAEHGPFRSDVAGEFIGNAKRFVFSCGGAEPCQVSQVQRGAIWDLEVLDERGAIQRFRLGLKAPAEFSYRGQSNSASQWPDPAVQGRAHLVSISLVAKGAGADVPILATRIWTEHPTDCGFDTALQDCR